MNRREALKAAACGVFGAAGATAATAAGPKGWIVTARPWASRRVDTDKTLAQERAEREAEARRSGRLSDLFALDAVENVREMMGIFAGGERSEYVQKTVEVESVEPFRPIGARREGDSDPEYGHPGYVSEADAIHFATKRDAERFVVTLEDAIGIEGGYNHDPLLRGGSGLRYRIVPADGFADPEPLTDEYEDAQFVMDVVVERGILPA